jgi:formiminotetrahydrofolate cyclodeaminase
MKLVDLKVNEFIDEVASSSPAPGGGSVSALASSIGLALTEMVGVFSNTKKKFKALEQVFQDEFNLVLEHFAMYKKEMVSLIDKDTEAFNLIMAAFKLPKETEEDKAKRLEAITEATKEAVKVPYRVAELSMQAMNELNIILVHGNRNTLSDLGVSVLMLHAGIEGAILNVKINLKGLQDEDFVQEYTNKVNRLFRESYMIKNEILTKIHNKL